MSTDPTTAGKKAQSCREALHAIADGYGAGISAAQRADAGRLARFMDRRPLIGLMLQHIILARYMAANKQTDMGAAADWPTIIQWLIANLPAILQFLLSFIALFDAE